MEVMSNVGELLKRRYVADFVSHMQRMRALELPDSVRCKKCGAGGCCHACYTTGIEPIPFSEVLNGR